jgi:hypothetical protein
VRVDVPAEVHEGIAFDARWTVEIEDGAHTLAIRCLERDGLAVVAGSTTIDGHALVDGTAPRIASGIVLHAVPARTRIAFAARCIAHAAGTVDLTIATAIDGADEHIASAAVRSIARAAFPQNPDRLRYYLDAPAIHAPMADTPLPDQPPPAPVHPVPATEDPTLDETRRTRLVRALGRAGDDAIADALGVLAALMPAGEPRDAFAENAERLSVKLRIPGYVAETEEYESPAAREALDDARGAAGLGALVAPRGSVAALAVWCATIDPLVAPSLPIVPYVRAFVRYADERAPNDRVALEAARDALRAAIAIAA